MMSQHEGRLQSSSRRADYHSAPRGITLLEVILATFILAVCAMSLLIASTTSGQATRQSSEYASAVAAARRKMEDLCNIRDFDTLVAGYGETNPTVGNTFKVYLNDSVQYVDNTGTKQRGQELVGYYKLVNGVANYDAGEVVIITTENRAASTYGYKCQLSPTDTYPDGTKTNGGINFSYLPIDLNGNGTTTDGNCYNMTSVPQVKTAKRLPVGVIVRWQGANGPERYELWTILGNY